jgi:hypothetical protein
MEGRAPFFVGKSGLPEQTVQGPLRKLTEGAEAGSTERAVPRWRYWSLRK